jgi:hypothetical protein
LYWRRTPGRSPACKHWVLHVAKVSRKIAGRRATRGTRVDLALLQLCLTGARTFYVSVGGARWPSSLSPFPVSAPQTETSSSYRLRLTSVVHIIPRIIDRDEMLTMKAECPVIGTSSCRNNRMAFRRPSLFTSKPCPSSSETNRLLRSLTVACSTTNTGWNVTARGHVTEFGQYRQPQAFQLRARSWRDPCIGWEYAHAM